MNYTTVEKIRVYLLKHESELDPEFQDIFEEVIGRKPSKARLSDRYVKFMRPERTYFDS